MKNNRNHGFALIELVIGIAVAAIVSGMVVSIVQFSSDSFRATTAEEATQRQAQTVTSQLNDFVINTKDAVCYYVENIMVSNDQNYEDVTAGSTTDLERVTTKEIRMYEKENGQVKEQIIVWDKSNQTLRLDEDTSDLKAAVILATNVFDFSVDLKDAFTHQKVYVTVKVINADKSYGVDIKTINLRNNLLINQVPVNDLIGEFMKEITGTKVTVSSTTLLPSKSVIVHGVVQANYSVSQACRYYILKNGTEKVTNITGYCSINEESGELTAEDQIYENKDIVVIAIPIAAMTAAYSESAQLALAGTVQVTIESRRITGTLISGSTSIDAGESEHYVASVSGYPGVSNDCIYTIEYNGARVTSFDNGAVIINNAGDVSCGIGLSQDYTVVIIATPKEIYESELSVIEKDALSGKLQVQLRKKADTQAKLIFVNLKTSMYNGQRSTFSVKEEHDFEITNTKWTISSGGDYATVDAITGKVTVKALAPENKSFTVKAVAQFGNVSISEKTIVTVKKPYFEVKILEGYQEVNKVQADFYDGWFNYYPETRDYTVQFKLNGSALGNTVSSITGTLSTYYQKSNNTKEKSFKGLENNNSNVSSYNIATTNQSIAFITYDGKKASLVDDRSFYLRITMNITLEDGTIGTIERVVDYEPYTYY